MYPVNPQPWLISDAQDELETLQDELPKLQDDISNKFQPRILRLSNSLPTLTPTRRNSCLVSVQTWKEGLTKPKSNSVLIPRTERQADQLHRLTRTSSQRLRTRSLERKPTLCLNATSGGARPNFKQHRKSSTYNGLGISLSSDNDERHLVGFHTHLPIERTVLSVLPPARKPSIDWTQPGNVTPISRPIRDSDHSSSSATCSASPQSTHATSVNSSETPTRPRYQPRPLLLSAFGSSKLTYTPSDSIDSISRKRNHISIDQTSNHPLNQQVLNKQIQSLEKLQYAQQIRQEKLSAHEAKKLRKSIREAELTAISTRTNNSNSNSNSNGHRPIPEPDEDDCWCWLSCSDAEDGSQDEEAEEMAVVWRASLDVGRRVSKNRKALGRGHGIRSPPAYPQFSNVHKSSPTSSLNSPQRHTQWSLLKLSSLMPHHSIKPFWQCPNFFQNPFKSSASAPFLFGSGLLSGLIFSVLSTALFWRIPSFLQRRLFTSSLNGIGFFFHFIFPNADPRFYSSTPLTFLHSSWIGTSLGLYTQW